MGTKAICLLVLAMVLGKPVMATGGDAETLLVIEPQEGNPRNSEGDMIELRDGRLCLIYTRFTGGSGDHAAADLAMRTSDDGGKSWSDDKIVVQRPGGLNVMSVSLLRLASGEIALFYLRKTSREDCRPLMCISTDEAETWSRSTIIEGNPDGWYCYTAVVFVKDRALLAYCAGDKRIGGLNRLRVLALSRDRLTSYFTE